MQNLDTSFPITATIPEFRRLSGISRSRIYELLDAGEIESVHIGTRRLILVDSYLKLIERQRAAKNQPGAGIDPGIPRAAAK
jgi:excisionase family DNA binding protein